MSLDPLHKEQFGEQLAMFERTSDVIDHVYKGDSVVDYVERANNLRRSTPREQWETPVRLGRHVLGRSLRDQKMEELDYLDRFEGVKPSTMGPIPIEHDVKTGEKRMPDGHHRLAFAEKHNMPWVPIVYRRNR